MNQYSKHYFLAGIAFLAAAFPVLEFALSTRGMSTCGQESIGCHIVGLVTPFGSLPFFALGIGLGLLLGFSALLRLQTLMLALMASAVAFEGILVSFQIHLGYFCQFCLIYAGIILFLTIYYIFFISRSSFFIFGACFLSGFLSLFLLFHPFLSADLKNSWLVEKNFNEVNKKTDSGVFYLFYSHQCGHCEATLKILEKNEKNLAGVFRLVVTDDNAGHSERAVQSISPNLFSKALSGISNGPIRPSEGVMQKTAAARSYVAKYGISETPTLIVVDGENWKTIISGTNNILQYLSLRFGVRFE